MPKPLIFTAALISVLLMLGLAGLQIHQSNRAREQAESALREAQQMSEGFRSTNSILSGELANLQAQAAELEQKLAEAAQAREGLTQKMRTELESRDVTITELQGKLTVNILDRVLFDSGLATLKPEGQAVLSKVARVLAQYPNRAIQVVGHTDNVPIFNRTTEGFTDNWSLSTGRALAAVRFLIDQAKVDPRRLSAVGCGEFKPVADNGTAEGRARNRRIAVVVLPEELAGSETPTKSLGGTNTTTGRTLVIRTISTTNAPAGTNTDGMPVP
jgi:chemotaxis protein MotB